ncbi:MAG: matrixin family metalloprotease, partial [Nitrososphaerales archaeon]
ILNNAEPQYENLFIDTVNTWSTSWSYLTYNFGRPFQDTCNITAYIVRASADVTSKGHAGITTAVYIPGGSIIRADILIPTEIEQQDGSVSRITATSFYRIAQHEFGHALGLLHADENYVEPFDIMSPILAADDKNMQISELDVSSLNTLYKVETEYVPPQEKKIEPLPPPTTGIPEVLQKMVINIDRAVYFTNETLTFTVKPPRTVSGVEASILLYSPNGKGKITLHVAPDSNGIINVQVPLQEKILGIWTVRVSYVSWVSDTAFALKSAGSIAPETRSPAGGFSITTDHSKYALGDSVAVFIRVSKSTGWSIEVLDSAGSIFTTIYPKSMKLKSDGTYEAIFKLVGDSAKSVGIWKARLVEGSSPAIERGSVTFDVAAMQLPTKAKVSLVGKQIRDLALLRLTNTGNTPLYGLIVRNGDNVIEACKGSKAWNVESCEPSKAILFTNDTPLEVGNKSYFSFKVGKGTAVFNWEVYDKDRHLLDSGILSAVSR